MRFGIFYEHQLPRPWDKDGEYRLLNIVARPDRVGRPARLRLRVGGRAPLPRGVLALLRPRGLSRRRQPAHPQIRLGHGIIQLTTNHPARVAERVSTLDLVRHGRVEFGMGEASSTTELHPFGRRFRDKREVWEEAVRAIIPMFGEGRTEHHGKYFDLPPRNVIPKPRAEAAPAACGSPARSLTRSGCTRGAGMGALRLPVRVRRGGPRLGEHYYNAFTKRQEKLCDYATNPNIAVVGGSCAARPTRRPTSRPTDGRSSPSPCATTPPTCRASRGRPSCGTSTCLSGEPRRSELHAGGLIGSPETIRTTPPQVRGFARRSGRSCSTRPAATRMRTSARPSSCSPTEAMPEFHDRDPEHQQWKEAVLAGEIALEEIDTQTYRTPRRGR